MKPMPDQIVDRRALNLKDIRHQSFLLLLRTDLIILANFVITAILFLFLVFYVVLLHNQLPPYVPLLYSLRWGESQLVPLSIFTALPLLPIGLVVLHTFLAWLLYKSFPILIRLLFFLTTIISFLLLITIIQITLQVRGV